MMLQYKGCNVASSSELGQLIAAGDTKKAAELYARLDAEYQQHWKPFPMLTNYKIGWDQRYAMMQFYHSHPNSGVKGIRAAYHIVGGRCTYFFYLPDQK